MGQTSPSNALEEEEAERVIPRVEILTLAVVEERMQRRSSHTFPAHRSLFLSEQEEPGQQAE